jgi:hypothetical protein
MLASLLKKVIWALCGLCDVCCSSARQSHAFDEGIVAWRVISIQILLRPLSCSLGCPFIRHIFFIRIMNIFDLLFEYSNNIRIFILLNK